jgi:dTDP-glucose pyrophosphorylase
MEAAYIKGDWFDAGTHESLVDAASALRAMNKPVEQFIASGASVSPKVVAGFLLYNSRKYLPQFLANASAGKRTEFASCST